MLRSVRLKITGTHLHAKQQVRVLHGTDGPLLHVVHGLGLEVTQAAARADGFVPAPVLRGAVHRALLVQQTARSGRENIVGFIYAGFQQVFS